MNGDRLQCSLRPLYSGILPRHLSAIDIRKAGAMDVAVDFKRSRSQRDVPCRTPAVAEARP